MIEIKESYENCEDIKRIAIYLKYQKVHCFKYNSDLDDGSSFRCFFESKVALSKNEEEIIIINRSNVRTRQYGEYDTHPCHDFIEKL